MPASARVNCLRVTAAILALVLATSRSDAVEIIGHRGASEDAPENTLASFRLAWTQNADAAETDVYLSKDGEIVVIHDANTRRVGNRNQKVVDQTLAELKQLDIGRWKGEQWAGERIPTLAELLKIIPRGKRLFIEIKCGPEIAPRLVQVLQAARKQPEQTCLISFSYEVMQRVKRELPALNCYWIVQLKRSRKTGTWSPPLAEIIQKTKEAGLDGVDFGDAPVIDREFVAKLKKAGLGVYTWTVNSTKEADRLEQAGVDGITTNRPGVLKEYFHGRLQKASQ
jgi:glycerophosphoryl diester phosphodiesterase